MSILILKLKLNNKKLITLNEHSLDKQIIEIKL